MAGRVSPKGCERISDFGQLRQGAVDGWNWTLGEGLGAKRQGAVVFSGETINQANFVSGGK